MIELTSVQQSVLSESNFNFFYAVRIDLPTHSRYFSTYFDTVTIGGNLYDSNSAILSVEPPKISTSVDREEFNITMADVNFVQGIAAENGIVGSDVEVRLVLISGSTGLPITNLADTIIIYKGQVDSVSYLINTADTGEAVFKISCASPMAKLDMSKPYYSSKTFVKEKVSSNDNSFDQLYQGSGSIRLKWGKV